MARSRWLLTVSSSGAASRSRAWWSPIAGVLPSPLSVLRPLDAFDRVVGDGVLLAEIFEQRGQRGQPVPDRRAAEPAPAQLVAPGDQMRAGHGAEFFRTADAGEAHEVLHRVFVGAAGVRVADVGEPFDLGRHVGEFLELGGGQQPVMPSTARLVNILTKPSI